MRDDVAAQAIRKLAVDVRACSLTSGPSRSPSHPASLLLRCRRPASAAKRSGRHAPDGADRLAGQPGCRRSTPFTDAIYQSCSSGAAASPPCQIVGGGRPIRTGSARLEVTVEQYVAFLNTADPTGRDRHKLYSENESSIGLAQVRADQLRARADRGHHYSVAYPEWADKPYGFANFLRAARFANSAHQRTPDRRSDRRPGRATYVIYRVRLSRNSERGMYNLRNRRRRAGRQAASSSPARTSGSRPPTSIRRAAGCTRTGSTRPTPGPFFDQPTQTSPDPSAPNTATLNPANGDVTNASTPAARDLPRLLVPDLVPVAGVNRTLQHASTRFI